MSAIESILITGAAGNNGTEILKRLSALGVPARAMIRSGGKAQHLQNLPGIELAEADFNDPESLSKVLAGVDRAFLLTNSSERVEAQQLAFVAAAQKNGVKHIVKLSQLGAAVNSPVRFLHYHAVVEKAIQDADIAFTFLRPNLFMQGLLMFRDSIIGEGRFYAPAGDARVSVVDVRDIAQSAVEALTGSGHEGKIYTLTGPEALTHAEMAETLSRTVGRPIEFIEVPEDAMRSAVLAAGIPPWQTEGLLEDYEHYRRGEAAAIEPGVFEATGQPPHSFAEFAKDYAGAFGGK